MKYCFISESMALSEDDVCSMCAHFAGCEPVLFFVSSGRRNTRFDCDWSSDGCSSDLGIVSSHAQTIRPATPQRTADSRCAAPTPEIAPVMVCVVLTGMPKCDATNRVMAPLVSAQKQIGRASCRERV